MSDFVQILQTNAGVQPLCCWVRGMWKTLRITKLFLSINLHTTVTTSSLCYCCRAALDCDGVVRSGSLLAVGACRVLRTGGVCIWWSGVTVVIVFLSKGEGHGHPDIDLTPGEKETGGESALNCL